MKNLLILFFFIFFLLNSLYSKENNTRLVGMVVDENNRPYENLFIIFNNEVLNRVKKAYDDKKIIFEKPKTTYTNSKGIFEINNLKVGENIIEIRLTKDHKFIKKVNIKEKENFIKIVILSNYEKSIDFKISIVEKLEIEKEKKEFKIFFVKFISVLILIFAINS
jgi:hypothetical protein